MSFRPDGYLLLWEAESILGRPRSSSGALFPMHEAASELLGYDWFEARNQPSEKYPGLSLVIEQDGSTAYVLNEVLSRWIFLTLLGGEYLPVYFCSPSGQTIRTLSFSETLTPLGRREVWQRFDPVHASIDDFVEAFMGIVNERFAIVDNACLVRKLPGTFAWQVRIHNLLSRNLVKTNPKPSEFEPFIGWSVCVGDDENLRDPLEMLSIPLRALRHEIYGPKTLEAGLKQEPLKKKSPGRPSLKPEIVTHFRNRFPDGRGSVSLSEVSRVLGYDRKTTRNALKEAGLLDDD